jgi:glucokinase
MRVLGADVGATNTRLALADVRDGRLAIAAERRYVNAEFGDFGRLIQAFVGEARVTTEADNRIDAACLGVAGPVEGRRVKLTNLPWALDADELARALGGARVTLVNDFHAAASGIDALDARDRVALQPGEPLAHGTQVVIGAGSGLGVALRVWTGTRHEVVPGEGGHIGFAPADAVQAALAEWLRARLARVIVEHVVSGPGLVRIHAFLCERHGVLAAPIDDPARIARAALGGEDPLAAEALDLFIACYGAVAGDYALAANARGGVFVAGGIAPKILTRLRAGGFVRAFTDKGVHAALAAKFPVHIVTNEGLGLLGALAVAAHG